MALSLKGVILVGGPSVGTRFRPLSMDCPKPLFPIAGVAMIHHHVSSLAKTPGMREILLIGFFENAVFDRFITEVSIEFPHLSIRHVRDARPHDTRHPPPRVPLVPPPPTPYLREYQSLGTGGGVYHFRDEILRGAPNAFFVLNGDIASSFPLNEMLLAHRNKKALATVMGIRVDKSKAHRYGCIVADADSRVIHFVEKPQSFISDLISCGVYLLSSDVFGYFQKAIQVRRDTEAELGLQSDQLANMSIYSSNAVLNSRSEERLQLEQDVLRVLATEKVLFAFEASSHKDFWMAVKHGSSAIPANRKYLQYFMQAQPRRLSEPVLLSPGKRLSFANSPAVTTPSVMSPAAMSPSTRDHPELIAPVYIHPSAIIHPSAKIGPNVSIGPR
ncbi:hypothetical protein HK105_207152, partial [Polyrhizophydium stewartii]